MSTLTLRGCDEELDRALKEASRRQGVSVNRLVLQTLREKLLGAGKKPRRYDDLDALAGTWTNAEAAQFNEAVRNFGKIDDELWDAQ